MSERTVEISKKIAKVKGWKLNPDMERVEFVIKGLNKNKKEKGYFYCPCKIVFGDIEKDKRIICPCQDSQMEIDRDGHCHCELFYKAD
ncbi:MAG: ferredoxin:thioredoxin reductase [Candidatus Lokiarchaeota archaeon]|nr:ferredoxin:thioredoxin reductase [Candidatus Lokiarchaeota archaeon]